MGITRWMRLVVGVDATNTMILWISIIAARIGNQESKANWPR